MAEPEFYYCGFSDHLPFKEASSSSSGFKKLSDLQLDVEFGKPLKAYLGWCSLFIVTTRNKLLFLAYNDPLDKEAVKVCDFNNPFSIKHIECGQKETYFLTKDGSVRKRINEDVCSGYSEQLVGFDEKAVSLSLGSTFVCVRLESGTVKAIDTDGNLVSFNSSKKIVSVACGHEHILLLNDDGQVYSYGVGSKGQLGLDCTDDVFEEEKLVEALDGVKIAKIAAGGWHSVALSTIGDIYVWGWNESGQLGLSREKTTLQLSPTLVPTEMDVSFVSVSCGSRHTALVTENGKFCAFGWNKWGQLGLNQKEQKYSDQIQVVSNDFKISDVVCKYWSTIVF